jgi:hypothetical protein
VGATAGEAIVVASESSMGAGDGIKIRTKCFLLHKQWQMGNYLTQKQSKAGGRVLSSLYYAKTILLWLWMTPCCWQKQKQKKAQPKAP